MVSPSLTLAELNKLHDERWGEWSARLETLGRKRPYRYFIKRRFVDQSHIHDALSQSVEAQVFAEEARFRTKMRESAREHRRKAANGAGRRDLIAQFASLPANRGVSTKSLWAPLKGFLDDRDLKPVFDRKSDCYVFNGKRGRIRLTYSNFLKRVSEVAPRRAARKAK